MRIFGEIDGIPEGSEFENRYFLSQYGVHRPLQAGISGSQVEGADSIVLSGGYEDDEDHGDTIIYTGHGGRNQVTGVQVANQTLTRQNLALALNCQLGLPIRVIRGYNHLSGFSPQTGYRYDGLYRVEHYWREPGQSGFDIWRFRLVKIDKPLSTFMLEESQPVYKKTARVETTIQRIIRDTNLSLSVKRMYDFQCQVCRTGIYINAGLYVEAAHIQPLGRPHNGPDSMDNILCLCPNHHVMLDFGGFSIADNLALIGMEGKLHQAPKHSINPIYLRYHREHFTNRI